MDSGPLAPMRRPCGIGEDAAVPMIEGSKGRLFFAAAAKKHIYSQNEKNKKI